MGIDSILIGCASNMPLRILQELIFYHLEKRGIQETKEIATKPDSTGMTPLYLLFKQQYELAEPYVLLQGLNKIKLLHYAALGILDQYEEFSENGNNVDDIYAFAKEFMLSVVADFPYACISLEWIRRIDTMAEMSEESSGKRFDTDKEEVISRTHHLLYCSLDSSFTTTFLHCNNHFSKTAIKDLVHRQNCVIHHFVDKLAQSSVNNFRPLHADDEHSASYLLHAIKQGLWWDGDHGDDDDKPMLIKGPLQKLLKNESGNLILEIDEETRLYPFMLAASKLVKNNNDILLTGASQPITDGSHKDEAHVWKQVRLLQLSTVFGLLRESVAFFDNVSLSNN